MNVKSVSNSVEESVVNQGGCAHRAMVMAQSAQTLGRRRRGATSEGVGSRRDRMRKYPPRVFQLFIFYFFSCGHILSMNI